MYGDEGNTLEFANEREDEQLCAMIEDLLPLYLEGEVNPGSREVIRQHLAECRHCGGFLAGAQSVRSQLRAERSQRASILAQDQPARRTVSKTQTLLAIIGMLAGYGLTLLGAFIFYQLIEHGHPEAGIWLPLAVLLGLGGLSISVLVARANGALTALRLIGLLAGSLIGALGSLLVNDTPAGLTLWLLGLCAVWVATSATGADGATPPAPAPATAAAGSSLAGGLRLPPQAGKALLLGVGAVAALVASSLLAPLIAEILFAPFASPMSAVLLVIIGILLWQRRQ